MQQHCHCRYYNYRKFTHGALPFPNSLKPRDHGFTEQILRSSVHVSQSAKYAMLHLQFHTHWPKRVKNAGRNSANPVSHSRASMEEGTHRPCSRVNHHLPDSEFYTVHFLQLYTHVGSMVAYAKGHLYLGIWTRRVWHTADPVPPKAEILKRKLETNQL